MHSKSWHGLAAALAATALAAAPAAAGEIFVGHLKDLTGPTSTVGKTYGQGVIDALDWINANGGVNGLPITYDSIDYSYKAPQAIAAYKKWTSSHAVAAIQGWGTGDTEALVQFVAKDEVPYFSASYSGHLTDPTGAGPETAVPAPYNFFYSPSYSDGCRGLVQWAGEDWKAKGASGKPKFVHMGDNHPYPNAPKAACAAYAVELGFEVLDPIVFSLSPGDFKAQCLTLNESGANYAFLANTSGAVISLLKSCRTVGTKVQFMANIWGYDENAMDAAGDAANGVVFVVGSVPWGADVPGMARVREVSRMSDPSGSLARGLHYMRAVCSVFYMKEALEWADTHGGISGANLKGAMESRERWVPEGLDGVCLPSTWTATDHRGTTTVNIYRGVVQATDKRMEKIYSAEIERRPEWLGM